MPRPVPEPIEFLGRTFTVVIDGPDADARYSATIIEAATGRMLTKTPVRGRSEDDVRDRAADVIRTLVTIERLSAIVVAVVGELAPGATVELTEDARALHADVRGGWVLSPPLALPREEITDPDADLDAWAKYIRDYLTAYLIPAGTA
ncbi:MAG TPA: hypothetical protein VGK88_07640 [bacterium]|jgi:hypothetical protein